MLLESSESLPRFIGYEHIYTPPIPARYNFLCRTQSTSWGRLCIKSGAIYTRRLKPGHGGYGDTFFIDEVFTGVPDHSNQW